MCSTCVFNAHQIKHIENALEEMCGHKYVSKTFQFDSHSIMGIENVVHVNSALDSLYPK